MVYMYEQSYGFGLYDGVVQHQTKYMYKRITRTYAQTHIYTKDDGFVSTARHGATVTSTFPINPPNPARNLREGNAGNRQTKKDDGNEHARAFVDGGRTRRREKKSSSSSSSSSHITQCAYISLIRSVGRRGSLHENVAAV